MSFVVRLSMAFRYMKFLLISRGYTMSREDNCITFTKGENRVSVARLFYKRPGFSKKLLMLSISMRFGESDEFVFPIRRIKEMGKVLLYLARFM